MIFTSQKSNSFVLFLGDALILFASIWIALLVRYLQFPSSEILALHLLPFSILIVIWCLVFFISGLYEHHILILKRDVAQMILNAQMVNIVLAVLFFYFIPYFTITPKVTLFIYLIVSLALIMIWRVFIASRNLSGEIQRALIIGEGEDVEAITVVLRNNPAHGVMIEQHITTGDIQTPDDVIEFAQNVSLVVADAGHEDVQTFLQKMYHMLFTGVQFIKTSDLYESMFGRVPLSLIDHRWFLENISSRTKVGYTFFKRCMDIIASVIVGIPALVLYPFVALAIKIEDGGKALIKQERVGQHGKLFSLYKFRSMSVDDDGEWIRKNDNRHTAVGKFIRKTRIDELPQLWNVLRGDVSLIGPRPDLKKFWDELSAEIPYYKMRNLVKPGLSGWAQITQDLPPQTLADNKVRLSYDLYYIKHRSIFLDIKIALRTIKTLLSRTGV